MNYSQYQLDIFDHLGHKRGNAAVMAVAGSGKTATAVASISHIPSFNQVLVGAFNTSIRDEFKSRIKQRNVECVSYNGFGWRLCQRNLKDPELNPKKTELILKHKVLGEKNWKEFRTFKAPIVRLISLFKSMSLHTPEEIWDSYDSVIEHHDIDVPEDTNFKTVLLNTFGECVKTTAMLDWDDQKYFPVHHGWTIPVYDQVIVDEFQDTCQLEMELMLAASSGGQFCGLGDPDQSIYGFKGANPDAFDKFIKQMNAKILPLSICYRCPISVINEAKKIVPRIEAAPGASIGSVNSIKMPDYKKLVMEGNFVLCRTTEPLVSECLRLIGEGRKAKVRGREIGDQLIGVIDKVCLEDYGMAIDLFLMRLGDWSMARFEYLTRMDKEAEIRSLEDKLLSIKVLTESCRYVQDLINKIDKIFTDDEHSGIDLMTIHKSKGLQNPKVFILRSELLPHPRAKKPWMMQEEIRLKYVAITRAEESLYFVS